MCYFLTVSVPEPYGIWFVRSMKPGYCLTVSGNRSLSSLLPEGHKSFYVTQGMCSCPLYRRLYDPEEHTEKIRKKYAKRGWTNAKIERSLAERAKNRRHGFMGLHPELRYVLAQTADVTEQISLLVHWYSGSPDEENVEPVSQSSINADELIRNDRAVAEDHLLTVKSRNTQK